VDNAERTAWFLAGITVAIIGGVIWRAQREILVILNVGTARMVERCRRCKREYSYRHPAQSKTARKYHDEFDCVADDEADEGDEQDCA
jgi:hypothetical protein